MSILGTCQECLHNKDGMCNLRPRICVNYDHFVWDKMIVISKNDLEQKYVSRFALDAANARAAELQAALDAAINMNIEKNAEVVRLTAALAAANEDAARLASESAFYEEGTGWRCIHCGENTKRNGYAVKHAADCPITLHRARAGGTS